MIYEIGDAERHSPRVTRKRQERKQAILAAALDVAREEGQEALTLQRVAERLDVTAGALYRYFASKDALVAELQRTVIERLAESTRSRIEHVANHAEVGAYPPGERALLDTIVTALSFEDFARTSPVEFGLLTLYLTAPEFALSEDEALHVFHTAAASLEGLAVQLEAAAAEDALSPGLSLDRAIALWAGLQGVVQTRKLARSAGGRIDPARIAHDLLTSLLVGWGADRQLVERLVCFALGTGFAEPADSASELLQAVPR